MESLPAEEKGRKNGHNFVQDGMGRARRVVTHFGRQWNADRGNGRPTTPDRGPRISLIRRPTVMSA